MLDLNSVSVTLLAVVCLTLPAWEISCCHIDYITIRSGNQLNLHMSTPHLGWENHVKYVLIVSAGGIKEGDMFQNLRMTFELFGQGRRVLWNWGRVGGGSNVGGINKFERNPNALTYLFSLPKNSRPQLDKSTN